MSGISKSQVSALCKDIDIRVNSFLDRPREGEWPYIWLHATYLKTRENRRVVSVAAIIATGVNTEGRHRASLQGELATLPRPLHAQRAGACAQGPAPDGRRRHTFRLRPEHSG